MKITVVSKMYNEEDLLPFWLNHYRFADEIIVLLGETSNDLSEEIIRSDPRSIIVRDGSPDGLMDDEICINGLNQIANSSDADWLIVADADEFIFPEGFLDPREFLASAGGNLMYSHMWDMFEHIDDLPLDKANPSIFQRRHGNPFIPNNNIKPNIVKPKEFKVRWSVGTHTTWPDPNIRPSSSRFLGAHWQSVDIELSVKRRIKGRKERNSQKEIDNLWGFHNFDLTREKIIELYEKHKNDPQLF